MTGQAVSQGMSAAWTGMSAGKTLLSTLVQLRSYPHGLKGERVYYLRWLRLRIRIRLRLRRW